jgi:predicted dithiol-disulfide oxidoreductase (DUF899 family)
MDTETLTPSDELAFKASKPYPGDSPEYRTARTALLAEEIELRRQIERVAALRRALPPGGEARDYRFTDEHGTELGLADLFGRHDTLVSYFWMYGPERERPVPDVYLVSQLVRRKSARPRAACRDRSDRTIEGRAPARLRSRAAAGEI